MKERITTIIHSVEPRDYWFVHVWNRIACLDNENSELELYSDGKVFSIDKMSLDEEVLSKLEPRKRMIFTLSEDVSVHLVHEVVKNAIESVQPKGVRFLRRQNGIVIWVLVNNFD